MPIYDLDINPVLVEQLPPDKRYISNATLIQSLCKPLQWAHDLLFNSYYAGPVCPNYAPGAWNKYDQVIYNKHVYVSLVGSNTNLPTVAGAWLLIQDNFIGVKERILYNGSKITLEYALNKEFNTVFRQPPTLSDIYITNIGPVPVGFFVAATEPFCSAVGATGSTATVGHASTFAQVNNFQINIPAAAYALTNDAAIRGFTNLYIPIGLNFIIVQY